MEFTDTIKRRKSTRKFSEEPVSKENLSEILLAANSAPVGSRRYDDIRLTVIQNRDILAQLGQAAQKMSQDRARMNAITGSDAAVDPNRKIDPFFGAPAVVMISHRNQTVQPGIEFANAACICQSMHLAATNLGLSSFILWGVLEAMKIYPELDNSSLLDLPDDFTPIMGLAIGHPAAPLTAREIDSDRLAVNYL